MMVGLTDDQAGKIAKHLKLQEGGPSYEAVRKQQTPSATQGYAGSFLFCLVRRNIPD